MDLPQDVKRRFLAAQQTLHPHPEHVKDSVFRLGGFFDSQDLVQVRYEMLRRHFCYEHPVARITHDFGVSRQQFYLLLRMFEQEGLAGLVPRKRGPKGAHECTEKVLVFAAGCRKKWPRRSAKDLADDVNKEFGLQLRPDILRKLLARREKGRHLKTPRPRQ